MKWGLLGARISLFPGPAPATHLPLADVLYRNVWGSAPEAFQNPSNALVPSLAQGRREGLTVGCSVHPSRIDFNCQPLTPEFGETLRLALIDDTEAVRRQLDLVARYVERSSVPDSIVRVGAFLQLATLTPDFLEANQVVIKTIPTRYRPKLEGEEDFIFQINPSRPSWVVPDLKMNFVVKWSTNRFQVLNMALPGMNGPAEFSAPRVGEFIGASITFDNNNMPSTTPLSLVQQASLLRESIGACGAQALETGISLEGF